MRPCGSHNAGSQQHLAALFAWQWFNQQLRHWMGRRGGGVVCVSSCHLVVCMCKWWWVNWPRLQVFKDPDHLWVVLGWCWGGAGVVLGWCWGGAGVVLVVGAGVVLVGFLLHIPAPSHPPWLLLQQLPSSITHDNCWMIQKDVASPPSLDSGPCFGIKNPPQLWQFLGAVRVVNTPSTKVIVLGTEARADMVIWLIHEGIAIYWKLPVTPASKRCHKLQLPPAFCRVSTVVMFAPSIVSSVRRSLGTGRGNVTAGDTRGVVTGTTNVTPWAHRV